MNILINLVLFTLIAATVWQTLLLTKIHALTNSNFHEAKAARAASDAALKVSQDLNVELRTRLKIAEVVND